MLIISLQIRQRKYVRFARTASINQGIKLHCPRTVSVSGWRGADQGWHLDGNQARGGRQIHLSKFWPALDLSLVDTDLTTQRQ